ncbi:MAG: hypothetical protein PUE04_01835 [Lachnospira sp.]|nr:hypothetical protein [Lachnospira sp.]
MHEFLRSLPPAGAFLGIFGSIATAERSLLTAVILMGIAVASVVYMHIDGRYGVG